MLKPRDDLIITIITILLCILIIWYYHQLGGTLNVPDIHTIQI